MSNYKQKGVELPSSILLHPVSTKLCLEKSIDFEDFEKKYYVRYTTQNQIDRYYSKTLITFGYYEKFGKTYILIESKNYTGENFWVIELESLNNIINNNNNSLKEHDTFQCKFPFGTPLSTTNFPNDFIIRDGVGKINKYNTWKIYKIINKNNERVIFFESLNYKTGNYWGIKEQDLIKILNNNSDELKLEITAKELLEIHNIACSQWKSNIASYMSRIDEKGNVLFTEFEIQQMIDACTKEQLPIVSKIFNYKSKSITKEELENLKIGDEVFLKSNNKEVYVYAYGTIDYNEPLNLIMVDRNKYLTKNELKFKNVDTKYYTFFQKGNYIVFKGTENKTEINFITKINKK